MKKIVILGCENSHANTFLGFIRDIKKFSDVEVVGVYSHEREAMEKLNAEFGVKIMDSYDEMVGKVDGVVITARHGNNHYKYAKPYIETGVPMFIDKPITISEEEAVEFMRLCRDNGVRVTGGSCLKHVDVIQKLKNEVENNVGGKTLGGFLRAPVSMNNEHGGFYFYSQHLAEMVMEAFGTYPNYVKADVNGDTISVLFSYNNYNVSAMFVDGNYVYYASRHSEEGYTGESFPIDGSSKCFYVEFDEFYELLQGANQKVSYEDFISPVFVLNAIKRAINSGEEEIVKDYKL